MKRLSRLASYLQNLQRFGIQPGLERIRALLARADNPQHKYPIVLVGGTNGKGSTCEFLARLLAEDGKKVGLYTSPHLYDWNERIRILNTECRETARELFPGVISDDELDALFARALPHIEAVAASELGQPTEFEVLTFLSLWHFALQKVDVAVVEVGLGGKWDATNATEPAVSVITHVALDHCDRLGSTLDAIARDKIGISRPGKVLVTAETKPEVLQIFREHCGNAHCELRIAKVPRSKDFQQINLATAQLAHQVLCESLNWQFTRHSSLVTRHSPVPARFETIRNHPRVILDGANNPDGASTLAAQLKSALAAVPEARLILVLGILLDKNWSGMVQVLAPLASAVNATQSDSPRAAAAELIAKEAQKYCAHVEQIVPVQAALEAALKLAGEADVICVTGSFYTVAEVEREKVVSQ